MRWLRSPCPDEGTLRPVLDHRESASLREHITHCRRCQEHLAELAANAGLVTQLLPALDHATTPPPLPLVMDSRRKEVPMGRLRVTFMSLSTLLVIALIAWLVPVGALADQVFQRFRIQQFAAITIPAETIRAFHDMGVIPAEQRDTFLSELEQVVNVTTDQREPQVREVQSLDEVTAHLGRTPLVPTKLPETLVGQPVQYFVAEEVYREATIDVAAAQQALRELGLQFASLPDPNVHPTLLIAITVPASAAQVWQVETGHGLLIAELESPTLELPAEIDPELLREDLLMVPGLPPDVVAQVRAVRDWRQTLIIPLPEGATSRQVSLRGTNGLFIESPDMVAVLWQERGILHVVSGQAIDSDQVLAVARSLR